MKPTSYIRRRSPAWRDFPIDLISRSPIARWAPVPLRLIVGYGFMEHGFAKLARGPDIPRDFARNWGPRTASHGMAHDLH